MFNNYVEQNEHMISINIGQEYACTKRVTLTDLMTTSDSSLSNQIKSHPKTTIDIENKMWEEL